MQSEIVRTKAVLAEAAQDGNDRFDEDENETAAKEIWVGS